MAYALLIHSLFAVASFACLVWILLALRNSARLIRQSRKHFQHVDAIDERIDALERGQDRHTDSLARMNGRLGAFVSKQNAARLDDTQPIDSDDTNTDREALYSKLAERSRG